MRSSKILCSRTWEEREISPQAEKANANPGAKRVLPDLLRQAECSDSGCKQRRERDNRHAKRKQVTELPPANPSKP